MVHLSLKTYIDKVLGCWYGKNAGGTLGAPLEKMWGREEAFNINWYLNLQEGGIPNDDLEIQIIWLQALEERGLNITCKDLAEYWLDCIWYNPDEYGFHKTNLRLGLLPPVSGWFNNPAKDCMGSPIRSEIWACIAPGLPHIAAKYAWYDAVCDHAGGEGVYGEMFNAAVESAAFVVSDINRLLDIGLSMIPPNCLVAKAIRTAREAKEEGLNWYEAREKVIKAVYSPNAQFAPINLGFQTIGLLYGEDFGDALCKTVNCGWDTDCTGATVGAILGIMYGKSNLPKKWLEPLGNTIATNATWGGIRNVRIPQTVEEFTERVVRVGLLLLSHHPDKIKITEEDNLSEIENLNLIDPQKAREIYEQSYVSNEFVLSSLNVLVSYPEGPVVYSGEETPLRVTFRNRQKEPLTLTTWLDLPEGFSYSPRERTVIKLPPSGEMEIEFSIIAPEPCLINTANYCWLKILTEGRPLSEALPVILVGARRWLISPLFTGATIETPIPLEESLNLTDFAKDWTVVSWPDNELQIEPYFAGNPGVIYLCHFVNSPEERMVRVGVPNSWRMKLWVNGEFAKQTEKIVPARPSYWGDESNYADVKFDKGWNTIVIKLERGKEPVKAYLTLAEPTLCAGLWDILQTRFPWEE
jgi:ADP-ribosylglycohydrolase